MVVWLCGRCFTASLSIKIRLASTQSRPRDMVFIDPPLPSSSLCTRSAYRLVLLTVMLCAYSAMGILWHWGPRSLYFDILSFIGLEPFRFPFLDIHAVLAAAECQRQGMDVYVSNPCDTIGRAHVYSPLWLAVTPALLSTKATPWVGLTLDLLFILSLVSVLRPRTSREIWIYGLAVLSPTTVYAVERANNDLVVFLLILSGGMLLTVRQPYRLCSYALFLVSGLLKYYPLALLVLLIRERRRAAVALLILLGIFLISFGMYFRLELAKALANIPAQSYFSDSFSAQNLPFGVGEILGSGFPPTLIATSLLGALLVMAAARTLRIVRLLGRHKLDCDSTEKRLLAIGGILLGACFFAGQNINYRGIYFLLVVPGLVALHRSVGKTALRQFHAQMIAAALFLMWEEFFRRALHAIVTLVPNRGLIYAEVCFWIGREFVWWWLVAGLAAIVLTYLRQLPVPNDIIVRFARRAILDKS
jgi:hypothetical protein